VILVIAIQFLESLSMSIREVVTLASVLASQTCEVGSIIDDH